MFFSESFATNLLSQSSVRYLTVASSNYFIVEKLLSDPAWKKINLNSGSSWLFENQSVRPRIYTTQDRETIYSNTEFQTIDYSFENASRWNFTIEKPIDPLWINFSEKYHPGWQLVCGNFHWYDSFLGKNKILSQGNHHKTDALLNNFLIDPIEAQKKCFTKNNLSIC